MCPVYSFLCVPCVAFISFVPCVHYVPCSRPVSLCPLCPLFASCVPMSLVWVLCPLCPLRRFYPLCLLWVLCPLCPVYSLCTPCPLCLLVSSVSLVASVAPGVPVAHVCGKSLLYRYSRQGEAGGTYSGFQMTDIIGGVFMRLKSSIFGFFC